jgi:hypothetical protein
MKGYVHEVQGDEKSDERMGCSPLGLAIMRGEYM